MVLSDDPLTTSRSLYCKQAIPRLCPFRVLTNSQVLVFHTWERKMTTEQLIGTRLPVKMEYWVRRKQKWVIRECRCLKEQRCKSESSLVRGNRGLMWSWRLLTSSSYRTPFHPIFQRYIYYFYVHVCLLGFVCTTCVQEPTGAWRGRQGPGNCSSRWF